MNKYKFIKVRTNQSEEEIDMILNNLAKDGWKVMSFYPTSDNELGKTGGVFYKNESWDVGYVFLLTKDN